MTRWPRWALPVAVGTAAGLLGIGIAVPLAAAAETRPRTEARGVRVPKLKGRQYVERYLDRAEEVSTIDGIATFGVAASKRESGWNNLVVNDSDAEKAAACKGWERQRTRDLAGTPYNQAKYYCWGTGGWYGQMPAYNLSRTPFQDLDPRWAVHDPATSTAMFIASKHSLIKHFLPKLPPEHRNWLAVRRSMASLRTMYDVEEKGDRARDVRKRFAADLEAIGVDPDFMYEQPHVRNYPGNGAVWDALQAIEARPAA